MLGSTYYRITAYNRPDLTTQLRDDDVATIIHYDATANLRVADAKFVEQKNTIPSLTFKIYPSNPGYDQLFEFDTLITLEEMGDEVATEYLGDPVADVHALYEYIGDPDEGDPDEGDPDEGDPDEGDPDEGDPDFLVLEMFEISNSYVEDSAFCLPEYSSADFLTTVTGFIEEDYKLVISSISTEATIPVVRNIFEGRVLQNTIQLDSNGLYYRNITCEGMLGYLCDSVQPYMDTVTWEDDDESTGLYKYMAHLLEEHNAQVEPHKQIYIGICDTSTHLTNEQVTKGTNWQSTWEVIDSKLIDVFGGEIDIKRGSDGLLYLYYTDKIADMNVLTKQNQVMKLGKNIIQGAYEPSVNQVITRLYPLGAKLSAIDGDGDEGSNNDSEERLTIKDADASDGKLYIEDEEMLERYGIVSTTETWDDVTIADNLYEKAVEWLAENNNFPVSLSLSAYDLSLLGYEYERLELYSRVDVEADILQADTLADNGLLEIVKRTLDLSEPWKSSIEFGETALSSSSQYKSLVSGSAE